MREKRARAQKTEKTVESWLGKPQLDLLLRLLGLATEGELNAACPTYLAMAKVPRSLALGTLQAAINDALLAQGNSDLKIPIAYAFFQNFKQMKWARADLS